MADPAPPEPDKLYNDNKVILKLFEALRTAIPPDVRLNMVERCSEELKFIAAVQPRVSSFSSRHRHSLRHPALSMATKRYYCSYRQRHAAQQFTEQQNGAMALPNYTAAEKTSQRGQPSVSHLVHQGTSVANDEGWSEFGMGMSNATWHFSRASQSAINVNMGGYQWPPRASVVQNSLQSGITALRSSASLVRAVEEQDSTSSMHRRSDVALRSRIKGLLLGFSVPDDSNTELLLKELPIKQVAQGSRAADDLLDPEEEQQFLLFQQNEDFRWDQLGFCYDQMLRAAASVVRPAAVRAAADARVNDIIRRFWDRLTVSPAAREAKRLEDERKAAAEATGFSGDGDGDGTPKGDAAGPSLATSGIGSRLVNKPKPKKKGSKKKKKDEVLATTASYMTPLQYIYLNMRISSILLPTCRALEMEMLEAVQEDLLIDVTYREDDPKLTLYFGRAPVLVQPEGVTLQRTPSSNLLFETARRRSDVERPDWKHNPWMGDGGNNACDESVDRKESHQDEHESRSADAIATWDPTRLPHLSYAQFWMSMLELTDNWTSTAANPVEYAIFLMELYMEVFGQNWTEDDATFTKTMQISVSQQQPDPSDNLSRAQFVAEALEEFHAAMNEINDSFSASSESSIRHDSSSAFSSSGSGAFRSPSPSDLEEDSSDEDESSLESSLNSLFDDMDSDGSPWAYMERVGPDGKVHRYRRKRILVPSKTRRKVGPDGKEGENDMSTWVIEEEIDEEGNVVRRRRLHKRHDDDDGVDGNGKRGKKKRKNGKHGTGDADSLSGSWSSYEDRLDADGHRTKTVSSRKEAERARRKSKRKKEPDERDEDDEGGDGNEKRKKKGEEGEDGKDGRRKKSRRSKTDENGVLVTGSDLDSELEEGGQGGGANGGKQRKPLTEEQRKELLERKQWLQQMLAAQGIHIRDDAFLDHKEEGLLYELLKTVERMNTHKKPTEGTDGEGGAEGDDTGTALIDVALLAELLSRPSVFSIEDLGKSALMAKLLETNENELRAVLPPGQMENVLAALLRPSSRGAQETATIRRRRQKLLEDARLLRLHNEGEGDGTAPDKDQPPPEQPEEPRDTFDLTEVDSAKATAPKDASRPTSAAGKPKLPVETAGDAKPSVSMTTLSFTGSRPVSPPRARTPPASPNVLRPKELTEEQLREQERLFREFEEFTAQQAEEELTYKVSFTEYTPEQLEAFFRHLHLGPQQQALLRGRAPLASATSLQGGTYHQLPSLGNSRNMRVQMGFQLGSSMAQVSRKTDAQQPYVPAKAAPVKLFTLTSQDTLQGAIRESYHSYLDDRAYQMSLQHARGLKGRPPKMADFRAHGTEERGGGSGGGGGGGGGGGEAPRVRRGFNFKKDESATTPEGPSSAPPAPSLTPKDPLPPLGSSKDAAKDHSL